MSALVAELLSGYENHINTSITIAVGYGIYFGIFSLLFYFDNKKRYKQMSGKMIKKELIHIITSFGIGEIAYFCMRWPTFYYFLEIKIEPFAASLISEIISTGVYMVIVTIFLRKTRAFSHQQA